VTQFVYLDNAATTPVRPEIREAMAPFFDGRMFGNPSSGHRIGREAKSALEGARRKLARVLDTDPAGLVFTSGGTEADNLAVLGAALRARDEGRAFRVAVASSEHKAVLDAAHAVERYGGEAVFLPVDGEGRVDDTAVSDALASGVAVLSVMWVNNETGVVQDVTRLAEQATAADVPFHTDAVQAIGKVPCSMSCGPITLLSISGHKIGAPKGIGALATTRSDLLEPLLHGGGQQRGVRPGTENVAFAVGLATAAELIVTELDEASRVMQHLRDTLEDSILTRIPDAQPTARSGRRAPHISNVTLRGADAGTVLTQLDLAGIACSSGSACNTGSPAPSHVLAAMGLDDALASASVRFSFSKANTLADIDHLMEVLPAAVERARVVAQRLGRS
jgi:cysteine desulfurase